MFTRTAAEWLKIYEERGAYWRYDPEAVKGGREDLHAELASKLHSDRFFNTRFLVEDDALLADAAHDIVERFIGWLGLEEKGLHHVQGVVGPARGATRLADLVALQIGERRHSTCPWGSPAKVGDGSILEFPEEGWKPISGSGIVLIVEDVITTGSTTSKAEDAVIREGAKTFTAVGCIVNRSGAEKVAVRGEVLKHVLANVHLSAPKWEPKDCPLCAKGSVAIKPKPEGDLEGLNWQRLQGRVNV